jgi:hypothetical protein
MESSAPPFVLLCELFVVFWEGVLFEASALFAWAWSSLGAGLRLSLLLLIFISFVCDCVTVVFFLQ